MKPLRVSRYTVTSALGRGIDSHWQALREERSGLSPQAFEDCALACWIGEVAGLDQPLEGELAGWDCRNNRLARLALAQDGFLPAALALRQRYGADRVGVFIGTSTAGIRQTERAYAARDDAASALSPGFDYRRTHNTYSIADFLRLELGLSGPTLAISTACSSSAKVFASAARAIRSGICDAAVVGGVDSLCLTTLYGFNALQLISPEACRPADASRVGISIGEAAGFALLEAPLEGRAQSGSDPLLLGYGESSDAYHMSTPHPDGVGAAAAMQAALDSAGIDAAGVDYINLHGTGTPANDLAEDRGVHTIFGGRTRCSSTKGWTGHTLGAAGIVEAAISLICLQQNFVPRSLNTRELDSQLRSAVQMQSSRQPLRRVLSNSFGFGGSNCSLLFGAAR
jgi:3-oxoacyl-[acyl-carrier-protein] synthase-1